MSKIAFTGGSITAGEGFVLPEENKFLWATLVRDNCYPDLELINAGCSGSSNSDTFKETIQIITSHSDLSVLFCSWVSLLRYKFSLGFELYNTVTTFFPHDDNLKSDFKLSTGAISNKYLLDIKNRFLTLHHYHYEICKLLTYVDIINKLCARVGVTVYHINDSCPWDNNYFTRLDRVLPEDYTNFTKNNIINIKHRSDEEIFKLYKKMHDEYDLAGGVDNTKWVNLYSSWMKNITDVNHDNQHPGKQSNFNYYTTVKNFLALQAPK